MGKDKKLREEILKDLADLYETAMKEGKYAVALKAKELLGREQGLFAQNKPKQQGSLVDLSEEDIIRLISEIERKLSLDPEQECE